MTIDLVQRLRTCPQEERKDVAMELAKTGREEAVEELIRMVHVDTISQTKDNKKHWYDLFKKHYNYTDQLTAIDALGNSRSKNALDYLKKVYEGGLECKPLKTVTYCDYPHKNGKTVVLYERHIVYPNAKGKLKSKLRYLFNKDVGLEWDMDPFIYYTDEMRVEEGDEKWVKKYPPHTTIKSAINKLEAIHRKPIFESQSKQPVKPTQPLTLKDVIVLGGVCRINDNRRGSSSCNWNL